MTTKTVEIKKEKDFSALKEFMAQLALNYYVDGGKQLIYTDEVKATLDNRYADYKNGIKMVSAEEGQQEIQLLLCGTQR